MQTEQILSFGPYRLDLANEQLWRGKQSVKITGKAFAVLRCLAEHSGQLVTKRELFQAVWPETVVSDAALTGCIQELRKALRDKARQPRFIETVHRRGYRFIASLSTTLSPVQSSKFEVQSPQFPLPPIVGRDAELVRLQSCLKAALKGERQIVFVTGEPGIGKTTLVDAFVERIAAENI